MKLLKKNNIKNNLNTELKEMGVFSAVAGKKRGLSTTGSLPPAVPLAITPTFSPWTHTSDDSYIYQLSLVLATATVSLFRNFSPVPSVCLVNFVSGSTPRINKSAKRSRLARRYNLTKIGIAAKVKTRQRIILFFL